MAEIAVALQNVWKRFPAPLVKQSLRSRIFLSKIEDGEFFACLAPRAAARRRRCA